MKKNPDKVICLGAFTLPWLWLDDVITGASLPIKKLKQNNSVHSVVDFCSCLSTNVLIKAMLKWKEGSLELIWLNYPGWKCPKRPKNTFLPKNLWVSMHELIMLNVTDSSTLKKDSFSGLIKCNIVFNIQCVLSFKHALFSHVYPCAVTLQ